MRRGEGGGLVVVTGRKALARLDDIARRGQLPTVTADIERYTRREEKG